MCVAEHRERPRSLRSMPPHWGPGTPRWPCFFRLRPPSSALREWQHNASAGARTAGSSSWTSRENARPAWSASFRTGACLFRSATCCPRRRSATAALRRTSSGRTRIDRGGVHAAEPGAAPHGTVPGIFPPRSRGRARVPGPRGCASRRGRSGPCQARNRGCGGLPAHEVPASRSVSRVLYHAHCARRRSSISGRRLPDGSSGRPEDHGSAPVVRRTGPVSSYLALLRVEFAAFHPAGRQVGPRSRLCGTGPRLTADGRYPLPCAAELGLSSGRTVSGRPATIRSARWPENSIPNTCSGRIIRGDGHPAASPRAVPDLTVLASLWVSCLA